MFACCPFFVLSWCKDFTCPNHTPTHVIFDCSLHIHAFYFIFFFRLLFMLHDCSEWRRYSLHLSAVVLGFLPLFRHISVLLCVIFITKMNTTYLQKYNAIQWWLLCVSVVVNFHELWLSDCVSIHFSGYSPAVKPQADFCLKCGAIFAHIWRLAMYHTCSDFIILDACMRYPSKKPTNMY